MHRVRNVADTFFDGGLLHHIIGEAGGNNNGGNAAIPAGDQPVPGKGNASTWSTAPVDGAADAAAMGAVASSSTS